MLCCTMWNAKEKPNYQELLKPFSKEMITLGTEGVEWCHRNLLKRFKVYLTLVTADAVARAFLQHLQQFNGKYGCPVCLTASVPLRKTNALHRIYTYCAAPVLRNSVDTLRLAKSVVSSCLLWLPYSIFSLTDLSITFCRISADYVLMV